jgi:hypothetical protein
MPEGKNVYGILFVLGLTIFIIIVTVFEEVQADCYSYCVTRPSCTYAFFLLLMVVIMMLVEVKLFFMWLGVLDLKKGR